jgi:hypothetical protein
MEELADLLKQQGKTILIYLGKEIKTDPEEESVSVTTFNPLPIKALVRDLTSSQMQWKMYGITTSQGKELICDKNYRNTIEQSHTIVIDGIKFTGWRDNFARMQIREEGNYIRVYVYQKE